MIYIAYCEQTKLTKVGYSDNVKQRMKTLKTTLFKEMIGDLKLEFKIHDYLRKKFKYMGEWYESSPSSVEFEINQILKDMNKLEYKEKTLNLLSDLLTILLKDKIANFTINLEHIKELICKNKTIISNSDIYDSDLYDDLIKKHLFSFLDNIDFFIVDNDEINNTLLWFSRRLFVIKKYLSERNISNKKRDLYFNILDCKLYKNKQGISEWINYKIPSVEDYWHLKNKVDYYNANIELIKVSSLLHKKDKIFNFNTTIKQFT